MILRLEAAFHNTGKYERTTLVSFRSRERVTIDMHPCVHHEGDGVRPPSCRRAHLGMRSAPAPCVTERSSPTGPGPSGELLPEREGGRIGGGRVEGECAHGPVGLSCAGERHG